MQTTIHRNGRCLVGLLSWLVALLAGFCPIASAGPMAYVTNEKSDDVSVIDAATNKVVRTIKVGKRPRGVAISPDGRRVYISNGNSDSVSVIDVEIGKQIEAWPAGVDPEGLALSPDGARLFAVNENGGTVTVIDTGRGTTVATIEVQTEPEWIAISPNGQVAYVSNETSSTISVIDTSALKVVATISMPKNPRGIAFSPDGKRAYVASEQAEPGMLSVIDTSDQWGSSSRKMAVGSTWHTERATPCTPSMLGPWRSRIRSTLVSVPGICPSPLTRAACMSPAAGVTRSR